MNIDKKQNKQFRIFFSIIFVMLKKIFIFIFIFYLALLLSNYLMPKVLSRINSKGVAKYQNQNYYTHEKPPINVVEAYSSQEADFYKNGNRNNIQIKLDPVSNYPYNLDLIKDLDFYPLSGLSKTKVSGCNELGYWPVISTDKFGNNNKVELEDAKVIIFGDSFGEAACVDQDKSIQSVISDLGLSTYSFSTGGASLLYATASFIEHINLAKNANKIVYLYYINDTGYPGGLLSEIKNPYLAPYLKKGYRQPNYIDKYLSKNTQKKLRDFSEEKIANTSGLYWYTRTSNPLTLKYKLLNILKLNWYKSLLHQAGIITHSKLEKEIIINLLSRMKNISKLHDKEFMITSIPVCKDEFNNLPVLEGKSKEGVMQGLDKNIKKIAAKLDIKVLDATTAFLDCDQYAKRRPNIMNSPSGIHFDEEGYNLIAEKLHQLLQ